MITLYAYKFRTRAERILWLLNELGLEYQVVRVSLSDVKKVNPLGKVPAVAINGAIYTESLAIMEYLVSLTSRADLVPCDNNEVYKFRHFMYYMLSEVESYLWLAEQASGLKALYSWPEGTYAEARARVANNIECLWDKVSDSGYICAAFTLADIYAYHVFTWSHTHGINLPEPILMYLKNLEQRASFPLEMKS